MDLNAFVRVKVFVVVVVSIELLYIFSSKLPAGDR